MSDPGVAYRGREELKRERGNDPIINLKTRLVHWDILTDDEAKTIDRDVRKMAKHEVQQAEQMPVPEPRLGVLFKDIYVPGSELLQRRGRTREESCY